VSEHNTSPDEIFKQNLVVSLPICNQEELIERTLENFFVSCTELCTLVIILDYCQDSTGMRVRNFLQEANHTEYVRSVLVLETTGDIFESNCENLALSLVEANYFLSLQADIMFTDPGFLEKCGSFMDSNPRLMGVSGRAVLFDKSSNLNLLVLSSRVIFHLINVFLGKAFRRKILPPYILSGNYFGDVSTPPQNRMYFFLNQSCRLYVGDALIRGPILWDAQKLVRLGKLNDVRYFLGGDEREICKLGRERFNYFVGFLPTTCYSDVWTGSSHNPQKRTPETILMLKKRTILSEEFEQVDLVPANQKNLASSSKKRRGRIISLNKNLA
jgi:hypothetical protein